MQNKKQMWHCTNNTLAKQTKVQVLSYCNDYEYKVNGAKKITALFLYKTVILIATIDSNAIMGQIRANFHELTSYELSKNCNMDKIHSYFNKNYTLLCPSGQKYHIFACCLPSLCTTQQPMLAIRSPSDLLDLILAATWIQVHLMYGMSIWYSTSA